MSEEPTTPDVVGLMRQSYEAVSRGELAAQLLSPHAVLDVSEVGFGTFVGEEEVTRFFGDWHRSWEDYRFEEEELRDLGHGVGLSVVRESGRLVGGKGRVEQRVAQVWIWASGKLEWLKAYRDPDEARANAERIAAERG